MESQDAPKVRSAPGFGLLALAIVVGASIISFGPSDGTPRYQLAAGNGVIVRMNNDSGEVVACDLRHCVTVQPPDRAKTLAPLNGALGRIEDQGNRAR